MTNPTPIKQIAPHGGVLINRLLDDAARSAALQEFSTLPQLTVGEREECDIETIAVGALSPLEGFMGPDDYHSVISRKRLANGLPWTIPVTLAVSAEEAKSVGVGARVGLKAEDGLPLAILEVTSIHPADRENEAKEVYKTTFDDKKHPGVAALHERGDVLLGGPISVINLPSHDDFQQYRLTPAQSRAAFLEHGWRRIVAFQTRNPIHRAHEYMQKVAMEITDGLFLHPLVGKTKDDDIPADVRMKTYEVIVEHYYPKDRVIIGVNPSAMRYAGPAEAIFHALIRKNYGVTHFIVGRDHAGVGNYYGTFDAHYIFDEFDPAELGITPLFFDHAFWCKRVGGMASVKTTPGTAEERIALSGTKVREMLVNGELPPAEFTRPEVAKILIEAYKKSK
jgi:sulfate adenylyltransferase